MNNLRFQTEVDTFSSKTLGSADGYKVGRVGPKQKPFWSKTNWSAVEQAYHQGHTRDDAIRQARLARILRWSEWDAKKLIRLDTAITHRSRRICESKTHGRTNQKSISL